MSQPKRILLLDTGHEWGGGTNSMFELLKRLDRQRFAVTCCFYKDYRKGEDGRLLSEELADIDIPLIVLPGRRQPLWAKLAKEVTRGLLTWSARLKKRAVRRIDRQWRILPRAREIRQVLAEGGFELLYMNNQPSSNLEGYLAAEALGLPMVQHCRVEPTLHGDEVEVVNRLATRIICVSQGVADVLAAQHVAENRLQVVYNAIDARTPLPPKAELPPFGNRPVIGTVGRLMPIKAVAHLIEAVHWLKAEGLAPACVIVGEGGQRAELVALAERLGVSELVHFAGFQRVPLAWVEAMDICVLCSSREGLPRVVLEAMLASKPVIGSDVTGTRELVVNEDTGLLYAYGDIPALVGALRRLLADPLLRRAMGESGRRRVVEHYSIEAYVAGVSRVLAEALS